MQPKITHKNEQNITVNVSNNATHKNCFQLNLNQFELCPKVNQASDKTEQCWKTLLFQIFHMRPKERQQHCSVRWNPEVPWVQGSERMLQQ